MYGWGSRNSVVWTVPNRYCTSTTYVYADGVNESIKPTRQPAPTSANANSNVAEPPAVADTRGTSDPTSSTDHPEMPTTPTTASANNSGTSATVNNSGTSADANISGTSADANLCGTAAVANMSGTSADANSSGTSGSGQTP